MPEAPTRRTRRTPAIERTRFAADVLFCFVVLTLGCQGQSVGAGPNLGGSSSATGSPTTSVGGSGATSTPVDVNDLVGVDPQQLPDGVPKNARVLRLSYDEYDRALTE